MAAELSLLFKLKAQNEAGATLKALEAQIASLKARIKEVKTESDIGFRTERIAAHQERLKALTAQHKELKDSIKASAVAHEDLTQALSAVSPRVGGLVSSLSSAAGPLAAVAVGLAAIGGGAVALFELTKGAAEFQGKMFDLSQQVGVSVETLSALEVVAKTSGASIEAIAQSLFIFQQKLADAQDPTSKEAALLKELGIETNNTEEAFRQALTVLAKMPEGFRQSNAAAELFGSRGGKQVLGVLKEMRGDLDGTIDRLRKMGVLITTEAAVAADKFNDRLAEVQFQLRGITATIGNEVMPIIVKSLESVSRLLIENQKNIARWTIEIIDAGKGAFVLAENVTGLIPLLQELNNLTPGRGSTLEALIRGIPVIGAVSTLSDIGKFSQSTPFIPPVSIPDLATPIRPPGPSGTTRKVAGRGGVRDTFLQDANREAALAEREALLLNSADVAENKRALDEQVRSLKEFTDRAIELADARHDAAIVRINAEQEALDQALAKRLIKQKEFDVQDRELTIRNTKAQQDNADEVFKLKRERDLKIAAQENAARQRDEQIAAEADQRIIARIKERVREEVITESEGIRQIAAIIDDGFRRRRQALQEEEDAYSSSLERIEEINAERIRLDGQRAGAAEEASRRIVEAIEKEKKAEFDRQNEGAQGATRQRKVFEESESPLDFDLEKIAKTIEKSIVPLNEILANSFLDVADAIGSVVANWVLLGETGPAVMRKILAQALAAIAAEAAINAVKQLALGFASLFFNPAESASHFTSAGLWASIAGVAAIAGRGVAGDLFKPQSHGRESSSSSNSPQELNPLTLSRNPRSNDQPLVVHLDIKQDRHSIVDVWTDDFTTGGRTREAVLNDGGIIP